MARTPKPLNPGPGVLIHEPVLTPFAKLNDAPYNPRTISDAEMRALKASIRKHGLVLTMVVQRNSEEHGPDIIVGGHQRKRAVFELAKELGIEPPSHCWSIVLDIDDITAKQLNISLNRIAGEFDPYKLGLVLADVSKDLSFDPTEIGFTSERVQELVKHATMTPDQLATLLEDQVANEGITGFASSITLSIEFAEVEQRDRARALLKELAAGGSPGTVLLGIMKKARLFKKSKVQATPE